MAAEMWNGLRSWAGSIHIPHRIYQINDAVIILPAAFTLGKD